MVTSPYEWNILEWDEKPQTNKQTNKHAIIILHDLTDFIYLHVEYIA